MMPVIDRLKLHLSVTILLILPTFVCLVNSVDLFL